MVTIGRHSFNKNYDDMTPTQKKNKRVDEIKDKWAHMNCYILLRIWEHDINKNPNKVMDILKENIKIGVKKQIITENKKKRHK